jgi:hypothetical protein
MRYMPVDHNPNALATVLNIKSVALFLCRIPREGYLLKRVSMYHTNVKIKDKNPA